MHNRPGIHRHWVNVVEHGGIRATSVMSSQICHRCGMVRSARICRPAPAYRQWFVPDHAAYRLEISHRARFITANLKCHHHKSASCKASFCWVWQVILPLAPLNPSTCAPQCATLPGGWDRFHQGNMRRFQRLTMEHITKNFLTKIVEPAPINVILGADIIRSPGLLE